MFIQFILSPLQGLLYPSLCYACKSETVSSAQPICLSCEYRIRPALYCLDRINPVSERLSTLFNYEEASCGFVFVKGGLLQELIHALKYKGREDIGIQLGRWYGHQLKSSTLYQEVRYVIPVPIHPQKEHERGYNQAALVAQGVAEVMGLTLRTDILKRVRYMDSQTKKSRTERFLNVQGCFQAKVVANSLEGGILLIDDVITTGATLSACVEALLQQKKNPIYIGAIALAD
jgi:competence protein ComFC